MLKDTVQSLNGKVADLQTELAWLKQKLFGPGKNEKQPDPETQAQLVLKLEQLQQQVAAVAR